MNQISETLNMRSNSDKDILLSLTIGFMAFLASANLLIRSSYHGLFSSLDTEIYLSVTENLTSGEGLRDYSYFPSSWWPPFYPLLLAVLNIFETEVRDASRTFNIVAFGLIIILTGHWLNRYIKSRLLIIGVVTAIAISHILNLITLFALSETLFILLTLLSLVSLDTFLNQRYSINALIFSALFGALATMTRFAGISIILTAIFSLIIDRKLPISKRLRYIVIYVAMSFSPLLSYLTYSRITTGYSLIGRYSSVEFIPLRQLISIIKMLYAWFFIPEVGNIHGLSGIVEGWTIRIYVDLLSPSWAIYYLCAVIGIITLVILVSIIQHVRVGIKQMIKCYSIWDLSSIRIFLILLIYIVTYILVLLAPFKGTGEIHYRFISPLYIPIIVLIVFILERLFCREAWKQLTVSKLALLTLLAFGCVLHINRAVRWNVDLTLKTLEYSNYNQYLQGYTLDSPTIEYLNTNNLNGDFLVNYLPIIYELTNVSPPVRTLNCSHSATQPINSMDSDPKEIYIILLTKVPGYTKYCDPQDLILQQYPHPEIIVETSDGIIYRINSIPNMIP